MERLAYYRKDEFEPEIAEQLNKALIDYTHKYDNECETEEDKELWQELMREDIEKWSMLY